MTEQDREYWQNNGYTEIGRIGEIGRAEAVALWVHDYWYTGCGAVVTENTLQEHQDWHGRVVTVPRSTTS